jgi:hypothetical protein
VSENSGTVLFIFVDLVDGIEKKPLFTVLIPQILPSTPQQSLFIYSSEEEILNFIWKKIYSGAVWQS